MQFGFMPGRGTTDALFIVRRMQEECRDKKKKLYRCFVDIEKAFDRVPRKVTEWAMKKKGFPEEIVRAVMSLYHGAKTKVRVGFELSQQFLVQVGVHRGYVLSALLFAIAVDVISENAREGLMNEILYADDLVLMSKSTENLKEKFLKWKEAFESKGLKVNLKKVKVTVSGSKGEVLKSKVDPCAECRKRVMANLMMCTKCGKWIHGSSSYSVFIRCFPFSRDGRIYPIPSAISRTPFLHLSRLRASSFFKPIFSVSSSTCFFQVFFGRPRFLLPLTSRFRATLKTLSSPSKH